MEPVTCDALDALNQTLCRQEDAQAFYSEVAERTMNLKGAEVFRELAADAQAQAEIIRDQIRSLTESNQWDLPECVLACDFSPESPRFPHELESQRQELRPDASEMEALLFAIEKVNEHYDYYVGRARAADDAQAKQLYEYLAEQARQRFEMLRLDYDSVSGMGGWAD